MVSEGGAVEILATVVDDWKEVKEGPLAEPPKEMPFFEHELVVIFPSAAEARMMDLLGSRSRLLATTLEGSPVVFRKGVLP